MKIIEKQLAQNMLTIKEEGPSVIRSLKRYIVQYLLFVIFAIALIVLSGDIGLPYKLGGKVHLIFAGVLLGAIFRDIGWFLKVKMVWPFNDKITDWDKVREIANDEGGDKKE